MIKPMHIQQFVNDTMKNGVNKRTGKPLSRKSVVHHLSFISAVLAYAVQNGLIESNPCKYVKVPKGMKNEKSIYSLEEVQKLMELLKEAPMNYRVFFMLAIYSGFRRGELLGLEWKDIDWENNIISVRRTSNYSPDIGIYTDTTKTVKSQRSLKFPQKIMDLLREYRSVQNDDKIAKGNKWVENDRLFTKWNGEPMHNNTPYTWLKRFCQAHNFRFCDVHSLRHFYAYALIGEGVDPASVSAALGHSAITTTTSIYCHAFQKARAKANEAITKVLDSDTLANRG